MADIQEHVAYLSQSIGPRPAGTEEEQQAALYITEQLQTDAGLPASIEDFNCNPDADLPKAICSGVVVIAAALACFLPVAAIPALILAVLATAVFVAEALGTPVVSRFLNRGVSQNVIAKYEPDFSPETGSTRRRKIVLVSHYDSGKVQFETKAPLFGVLPILNWAAVGGMAASVVLLLVRCVSALEGTGLIVVNVLAVVALLAAAWPLLLCVMHRAASYNEGANCNAAGVAVLMDVAARVGKGRLSQAELDRLGVDGAVVHGQEAARRSGAVDDGTELVYETAPTEQREESAAERLLSAKAAVAALTGMPVSDTINIDIPEEEPPAPAVAPEGEAVSEEVLPQDDQEETLAPGEEDALEIEPEGEAAPSVPDWFKAAQEKAKKPEEDKHPVQRSRYADALDAALADQRPNRFSAPVETGLSETEQRLQQMRESIMEVKAPGFRRDDAPADAAAEAAQEAPAAQSAPEGDEPGGATVAFRPVPLDIPAVDAPDVLGAAAKESPASILDDAVADLRAQEGITVREPRPLTGSQPEAEAAVDRGALAESLAAAIPSIQSPASLSASIPAIGGEAAGKKPTRRRRAISLPSIGGEADGLTPLDELSKQRAPLAEERQPGTGRVRDLRAVLPSIGAAQDDKAAAIASLSGSFAPVAPEAAAADAGDAADADAPSVARAGAFAVASSTGSFTPVGDELLEDVDPDDMYIDDADDSDYEDVITETGAFSGPGYVDMPKSRAQRFLGKFGFGRKRHEAETSPQEWLDVDDEFEAQAAGAARGGWESFRQEDDVYEESADYYEDEYYEEGDADDEEGEVFEAYYDEDDAPHGAGTRWNGGSFSREQLGRVSTLSEDVAPEQPADVADEAVADVEGIYRFRNPDINTEVWFVALGAELAGNGGMNAFLDEHSQDMRGAIIIDLDALGAGDLTLIDREGTYLPRQASSRMRRLAKKAATAVGMTVGSGTMLWMDSAAACAMRRGCQVMHLVGMDAGKPAYFGQSDDVVENVSRDRMTANADFVMELLKNI
ncbi:MAG: M28 family peptidase [Eggerthellaceae bacterium]|nr:M28 family peptidase [Eggerthellaceae bacterium]